METFISPSERVTGNYLEKPNIAAAIENQRTKLGPLTPADAKAALRAECFPGENPTV